MAKVLVILFFFSILFALLLCLGQFYFQFLLPIFRSF